MAFSAQSHVPICNQCFPTLPPPPQINRYLHWNPDLRVCFWRTETKKIIPISLINKIHLSLPLTALSCYDPREKPANVDVSLWAALPEVNERIPPTSQLKHCFVLRLRLVVQLDSLPSNQGCLIIRLQHAPVTTSNA